MKKVQIIGVHEHFNLPWHLAIEEGAFKERGIDLVWTDIPEGTGKMCQMLQREETDMAIILTEGIIKSIAEGNPSKIVQEYIATPLLWGIHVGAESSHNVISDLENAKAAISRYGSGSHLMTYVHAENNNWNTSKLQFEVIDNLNGAITALTDDNTDYYFMWEHFTTQPLVDNNTFKRLDDCSAPWPCFVVAATEKFIKENKNTVKHILEVINLYTSEFKSIPSIDRTLANRYHQELDDIQEWLSITQWSQQRMPKEVLEKVKNTLLQLNLIDADLDTEKLTLNEL